MARSRGSPRSPTIAAVVAYLGAKQLVFGALMMFLLVAALVRSIQDRAPGREFLPVLGGRLISDPFAARSEHLGLEHRDERVHIQDIVLLPEDEILLLVRTPPLYQLPDPDEISCIFRNEGLTPVLGMDIDLEHGRASVRCAAPSNHSAFVGLKTEEGGELRLEPGTQMVHWFRLAFEAASSPQGTVLFAKGITSKRSHKVKDHGYKCVFDGGIKTSVTSASQEVFRCGDPPRELRQSLVGSRLSLEVDGKVIPSVARYRSKQRSPSHKPRKYYLCSCTMVYNAAKFLKEWVMYHSKLGVEKFFLYDNNSEDNIKQVLEELSAYNVSRQFWPWIKSQEAGFSHCALRAQEECTWLSYNDVDEFVLPGAWLGKSKPLVSLVQDIDGKVNPWYRNLGRLWRKQVGQIMLSCRVFGPSGLREHPAAGVTQGYTCRLKKGQRHKSIVLLDAVHPSLMNVVHHFRLRPKYRSAYVPPGRGSIQHYKYQVWDEFKTKFKRRVSTYVTDWKVGKNLDSKDRTPGLGTEDVEPADWKRRFCQVRDRIIQRYVTDTFGARDERGVLRLPWQK